MTSGTDSAPKTTRHDTKRPVQIRKHSVLQSIVLHLLPGAIIAVSYIASAPIVNRLSGLPPEFAFDVVILLVLVPLELGYLLQRGKRRHKISFEKVIRFRERIPPWQFILVVPILVFWGVYCFAGLLESVDRFLIKSLFVWAPERFLSSPASLSRFLDLELLGIGIASLLLSAIVAPLVEELYFRGYLLPRMSNRLKGWAPLLNVILYSLYFIWAPGQFGIRFLAFLPMVYVVWWRKNVYFGILTHCAVKTILPFAVLNNLFQ